MNESAPPIASPPPNLDALRALREPVRNANAVHEAQFSTLERVALFITERVGTMGFFLLIVTWTVLWLGWNLLAPKALQFDPPSAWVHLTCCGMKYRNPCQNSIPNNAST